MYKHWLPDGGSKLLEPHAALVHIIHKVRSELSWWYSGGLTYSFSDKEKMYSSLFSLSLTHTLTLAHTLTPKMSNAQAHTFAHMLFH